MSNDPSTPAPASPDVPAAAARGTSSSSGLIERDLYIFHGTRSAFDSIRLPGEAGFVSEVGQANGAAFYTFATDDPALVDTIRDNARVYADNGLLLGGVVRAGEVRMIDGEAMLGDELSDQFRAQLRGIQTGDPLLDRYLGHVAESITPTETGASLWTRLSTTTDIRPWLERDAVERLGANPAATLRADRARLNAALETQGLGVLSDLEAMTPAQSAAVAQALRQLQPEHPGYGMYYEQLAQRVESGDIRHGIDIVRQTSSDRFLLTAAREAAFQGIELPSAGTMDALWIKTIGSMDIAGISYSTDGARTALFQGEVGVRQLPALRIEEMHGAAPADLRADRTRPLQVGEVLLPEGGGRANAAPAIDRRAPDSPMRSTAALRETVADVPARSATDDVLRDRFGRSVVPRGGLSMDPTLAVPSWMEGQERLPPLDMEGLQNQLRREGLAALEEAGMARTPPEAFGRKEPAEQLRTTSQLRPETAADRPLRRGTATLTPQPANDAAMGAIRTAEADTIAREAARLEQATLARVAGSMGAVDASQAALHAYNELGHAGRIGALLRRGAQKIPVAGVLLAGGFAAYALYNAERGFSEGNMNEVQINAVRAALVPYVMTQAGSLVTGVAGEEAIDASLAAVGVPHEYRLGTLREAIASGAQAALDARDFSARKAAIPQPTVDAFVTALREARGPTPDPALNDFIAARDAATAQGYWGQDMGAKVGRVPYSQDRVQADINEAARTYLAYGGTIDTALAALSDDPARTRVEGQIIDVINLAPTPSANATVYPSNNEHLERLRELKTQREASRDETQRDVLWSQMRTEAAEYIGQGKDARDALFAYYRASPFGVATQTMEQMQTNSDMLHAFDGADGSKRDGLVSTREIGQALANRGVYTNRIDANRDGEADFAELQAVIRNPETFRSNGR